MPRNMLNHLSSFFPTQIQLVWKNRENRLHLQVKSSPILRRHGRPRPRPLQDLHEDILHMNLRRIPCGADRGRMSLVCRASRDQRRRLGRLLLRPPALPWLLLPAPFSVRCLACVLSACRAHHYLAVAPTRVALLRFPRRRLALRRDPPPARPQGPPRPLRLRPRLPAGAPAPDRPVPVRPPDGHPRRRAPALSTWPNEPNYVGAAIVTSWQSTHPRSTRPPCRHTAAVSRSGAGAGVAPMIPRAPGHDAAALDAEDVLYHRAGGSFFFLTQGEHTRVCAPRTHWETVRFCPGGRCYDQYVRARYLVVSRRVHAHGRQVHASA
jgi:hypothetical protein